MTSRARGTFEVRVTPLPADATVDGLAIGRLAFDKQFVGDLDGTSKGEMMTAATGVEGSRGYVAIERVVGTLHGRTGSFALLHQGTMKRGGDFTLRVVVVPDSGTDQLAGLTGTMAIVVKDGTHSYALEYSTR